MFVRNVVYRIKNRIYKTIPLFTFFVSMLPIKNTLASNANQKVMSTFSSKIDQNFELRVGGYDPAI